jgi:hypothetical protein
MEGERVEGLAGGGGGRAPGRRLPRPRLGGKLVDTIDA